MSQWKNPSHFCVGEHIYNAAFRRQDKKPPTKNNVGLFKCSDTQIKTTTAWNGDKGSIDAKEARRIKVHQQAGT